MSEQIGRLFWRAALKCVGAIRFKLDVTGSFEEASALKFDTRRQISSHDLRLNFIFPAMLSTNPSPQVFVFKGLTKKMTGKFTQISRLAPEMLILTLDVNISKNLKNLY